MIRGNGAKYFPLDNQEMDTLIEGLDAPVTTSAAVPSTSTAATFSRGSTFEQNYTSLGNPEAGESYHPQSSIGRAERTSQRITREIERQHSMSHYYTNVEQEESIKCVISSLLFVGIVLLVLIIAFVYNPQMA